MSKQPNLLFIYTNEQRADPLRTIVTPDRWKLTVPTTGADRLFDLETDPHETQNLAGLPQHQERIQELRQRIRSWQIQTNDSP